MILNKISRFSNSLVAVGAVGFRGLQYLELSIRKTGFMPLLLLPLSFPI